jgi:TatD DNase family protein
MRPLFDAHCHLRDASPPGEDHRRVVCGTCEADWEAVLAHAANDGRVIPLLGLHPWFVAEASTGWAERLEALLRSHPAGVGECGLDAARKDANLAAQSTALRIQLRLATALDRPVALHGVRAWGRLLRILQEEGVPRAGAMVHGFAGSPEVARDLQAMGLFVSFSGELLNPHRPKPRTALQGVADAQLLLETDGRGPLEAVLEVAAPLRGVSADQLARQTWDNGQRCFRELTR